MEALVGLFFFSSVRREETSLHPISSTRRTLMLLNVFLFETQRFGGVQN